MGFWPGPVKRDTGIFDPALTDFPGNFCRDQGAIGTESGFYPRWLHDSPDPRYPPVKGAPHR